MQTTPVGTKDEVPFAVADVVERHRGKGLEERAATLRAKLVLDAPVDDHDISLAERAGLRADCHLELPLEHVHHLLGVLVRVAGGGRAPPRAAPAGAAPPPPRREWRRR